MIVIDVDDNTEKSGTPKFKVGDWVVLENPELPAEQVTEVREGMKFRTVPTGKFSYKTTNCFGRNPNIWFTELLLEKVHLDSRPIDWIRYQIRDDGTCSYCGHDAELIELPDGDCTQSDRCIGCDDFNDSLLLEGW